MSEMAIRITDGKEVKIGTCNEMLYCRYDQLDQIDYEYMTDGLLWRMPIPEEDNIKPGDFCYPQIQTTYMPLHLMIDEDKLELEGKALMMRSPGVHQMYDSKMGLLATVNCYHGLKLPENNSDVRFSWNGKSNPLHLSFLENGKDQMYVCVSCHCCRKTWGFSFNEIEPAIYSLWMKIRIWHACTDYWFSLPSKKSADKPYDFFITGSGNRLFRVSTNEEGEYLLIRIFKEPEGKTLIEARGSWTEVRNALLQRLAPKGEAYQMQERYLKKTSAR